MKFNVETLILFGTLGVLYLLFSVYPFHKKRLRVATDEGERRDIKTRIGVLIIGIAALITGIIFFTWVLFNRE